MFDVIFENVKVIGIPLLFFTLALVQWIKTSFKVKGTNVNIVSLFTGVILGICYQLSVGIPSGFAGWFGVVIFGLALGLAASGAFDAARQIASGESKG